MRNSYLSGVSNFSVPSDNRFLAHELKRVLTDKNIV